MQDAERQLDAGSGEKAGRSAEEARRYLEQLKQELEQEERRYEQLRQEEVMYRLVQDLKEFRTEQQRIHDETRKISDAAAGGTLARVQRRALKALGREEELLRARVTERVKVLLEEESPAFGTALEAASLDMAEIARLLEDEQHGRAVQGLAEEVIHQLTQLIQAFEDEIQRRQQQGGGGPPPPPGGGRAPLVPPTVEIKLLRRMQMDLNAKVETFWRQNPAVKEGKIEDRQRRTLERLYNRQGKIADDLEKLVRSVYGRGGS
jgi:hypothetical protein